MKYRLSVLLTLFLFSLAITAMQPRPRPIPQYEGDSNPQHDGQPAFCVNHEHSGYVKNCACKGMGGDCDLPRGGSGGGESPNCKVYCRKSSCRCINPCES